MARKRAFYAMVNAPSAKQAADCVNLAQRILDLRSTDRAHYRRVMRKLAEIESRRKAA